MRVNGFKINHLEILFQKYSSSKYFLSLIPLPFPQDCYTHIKLHQIRGYCDSGIFCVNLGFYYSFRYWSICSFMVRGSGWGKVIGGYGGYCYIIQLAETFDQYMRESLTIFTYYKYIYPLLHEER